MFNTVSDSVVMEAEEPQGGDGLRTLAPWWHTSLVALQLIALALIGPRSASSRLTEPHVFLYTAGLMSQWLQLSAVVAGLNQRRQFFRDTLRGGLGTWRSEAPRGGLLFLCTMVMFVVVTALLHAARLRPSFDREVMDSMAPKNAVELLFWLVLCVVIGFSEELVFRGYLLRQTVVWARRMGASPTLAAVVAVVLTSVLFGSLHVYEGVGGAILIGILGAMYAVVALRRGNLRAVIVAHVLQDFLTAVMVMTRRGHGGH